MIEIILIVFALLFVLVLRSNRVEFPDGHIEDPNKDHIINIVNLMYEYIYLFIDFIKKIGITFLSI